MGIERDRVFHANFEQGSAENRFINLAKTVTKDNETSALIVRNKDIDALFGDYVLDATNGGLVTKVEFTNPEELRPISTRTFEHRFAVFFPSSLSDDTRDLYGEDGTDFWRIEHVLDAAGDRIEFTVSQTTAAKVFVFDFGVGAFTRDVWNVFRITYDGTTMRCYLNGVKNSSDVTRASLMTGHWTDAVGTIFRIGARSVTHIAVYIDHILIERGADSVLTAATYTLETESFQKEAPTFPIAYSQGSGTGPSLKTDVLRIVSGHEQRETINLSNRNNFQVSLENKTQLELETLIALAHICRGRGRVFRFKDWLEFTTTTPNGIITISDQTIGVGDGATTKFQLTKTFFKDLDKSNIDFVRNVTRPVPGTVMVSIDDVETSAFRMDHGTGIVYFTTAPAVDEVVKWGGEYDIPCRFNNDDIRLNMSKFENGESNFDLIEVPNG